MKFLQLAKKYETELINDLNGLLAIESTLEENPDSKDAPFGEGIRKSLDYVLALGERYGFKTMNIDNVAGHIEYGEGEDIIGILCHVDVVPAEGEWDYPPFAGTFVNGKIYGRGTVDDKGPTICSLYALRILKDLNIMPKKKIRLIIGTDEESKWRGITRYFQVCSMPGFGFSPDADFPLIYGEKGILHIELVDNCQSLLRVKSGSRYNVVPAQAIADVDCSIKKEYLDYLANNKISGYIDNNTFFLKGKSAHAMEPDNGINAAVKMSQFLVGHTDNNLIRFVNDILSDSRLKNAGLAYSDPEMNDLTCNLGILEINENKGKACLDFRYPIRWDKDQFLKRFRATAANYQLCFNITADKPVHYVNKDDSDIMKLHQAYIKYTDDTQTPLQTIGGGTYARALQKGIAFGIAFPGREEVAHRANEYIAIDDLLTATAIYTEAISKLGCV
ncbi:MAG: dipeptidase PepV [Bacilli bacterium]|nr:dipeptidase PepV [Bacilli bacterium]MDD4076887.1 dipeptidase PepV [Bacilli bacterium]MDD4387875.1 dipeptidase PepV [Bacilli bacterium]